MFLMYLIAIPLIGAIITLFMRKRSFNMPFVTSALVLVLGLLGFKDVLKGIPITYKIPLSGPFAPAFRGDSLSVVFVILASFLWLVVSLYAPKYMKHEGKYKMYELCTLVTLSSVLGVLLAGNLFTMLLFFELMTVSSYFWVVHRWNREVIRAGYFYLFFGIIGGLLLALGIVFLGGATDVLPTIGSGIVLPTDPKLFTWSIILLVAGFGIKAGMAPLHLWLPHAHSSAPTPGSALLSGLLIKVGAYGLIRVGEFAGWGMGYGSGVIDLGTPLTILGIITMLVGVVAALLQSDAKRLLAYHSVSQMGYIILGLGVGLYLGPNGELGLLGSIYHIVNHALFKATLFLGVGVIYIHTKETDLYKLGGLWRRFPVTAFLMLLAVLGITGAPGLNGYASKTLLHHGVTLAAETGASWMVWVERLFLVVGVGTAASFSKLYYLIFLGKPTKIQVSKGKNPSLQVAMGPLALVMVIIGLSPKLLPKETMLPAVGGLGMAKAAGSLAEVSFWNMTDIISMIITLILGMLVCWAGLKSGVFHWQPPVWLTLEGLGRLTGSGLIFLWQTGSGFYQSGVKVVRVAGRAIRSSLCGSDGRLRVGKFSFAGVGADAALLIATLTILIVWYTLINPGLFHINLPLFFSQWK